MQRYNGMKDSMVSGEPSMDAGVCHMPQAQENSCTLETTLFEFLTSQEMAARRVGCNSYD